MVLGSITPPLIPLGLPPLPATAVDTKTLSPTTIGCDQPLPSIGVRQAACGGWVQSLGSCDCALTLNALPPRNCRQSSALLAAGLPTLVTSNIINPMADAFGSQSFDALMRICFMFILFVPDLKTDWVKTDWVKTDWVKTRWLKTRWLKTLWAEHLAGDLAKDLAEDLTVQCTEWANSR
jgi:hypothetical protein